MGLRARQVGYSYPGPVLAVQGVDLEVAEGELVTVLGPNGSGKSTLLRLLAGLVRPAQGQVELDGSEVRSYSPRDRARQVALVPQVLTSLPEITVQHFVQGGRYAQLGLWRQHTRRDREVVEESLAAADVAGFGDRLLDQLSAGQRQRVLIARALAQEATIMLVDEPTTSLDPEHQILVFDLLARLCASGRAAVVVTHEINLASQFARRVVVLDRGRVAAEGAAEDVFRREVLEPVYGGHFHYGSLPAPHGGGERPFVIPWMRGDSDRS